MSNLESSSIIKKITIDQNHIDQFVLETTEGTKRTKEKFYREASEQRNSYVRNQQSIFENCLLEIKNEMARRVPELLPVDMSEEYTRDLVEVNDLLDAVKLYSNLSNSFQLKLDFLVSSITDDTSLEELNVLLGKFISRFRDMGILITKDDFCYTMFTEQYMNSFFQKFDFGLLKETFEKIYFACPDIKLQLKMNLSYIIQKYDKDLTKKVLSLREDACRKYQVTADTIVDKYIEARERVGNAIAKDSFYNTKLFLDGKKKITDYLEGAPAREKNYDMFSANGSYASLDTEGKTGYQSAIMGFYLTLNELKKYYGYEFIVKDLLERYKNKDSIKTTYVTKKKELEKEEKVRETIYKDYLKGMGIGLFARKNEEKVHNSMLKMNEQVRKLHALYDELEDLDITYQLSSLGEAASIYDLFIVSLRSFPFLEKSFRGEEKFADEPLEDTIQEFFRFLYNPNNNFLRKINVFTDYNITNIVAEKYKLLNLNVTPELIDSEHIDSTLESVGFINLIQNIESSDTSLSDIEILYKMESILAQEQADSME